MRVLIAIYRYIFSNYFTNVLTRHCKAPVEGSDVNFNPFLGNCLPIIWILTLVVTTLLAETGGKRGPGLCDWEGHKVVLQIQQ